MIFKPVYYNDGLNPFWNAIQDLPEEKKSEMLKHARVLETSERYILSVLNRPTFKPCPFCGSDGYQVLASDEGFSKVRCNRCGAAGGIETSDEAAIKAWNLRSEERA